MWFESLTGFREETPEQVRANIVVKADRMICKVNGREMVCGYLETPTLADLRGRVRDAGVPSGTMRLSEIVSDVQRLHQDPGNAGALFQVASQFNLLEMVSSSVTPEHGVGIYEQDWTQGPACAMACGAGTIFRNYFADVNGQIGQSASNQIDCLRDLGHALDNSDERLWRMRNGYALASAEGLAEISQRIASSGNSDLDRLRERLRIGIHSDTQVTIGEVDHTVTQAYCSALPVAYSPHSPDLWASFAQLVLEASYEATICAGTLNSARTGNNKVFLTLLGGGVFGNREDWILGAIGRAIRTFAQTPLDVSIVSYGRPNPCIGELIRTCTTSTGCRESV
jgi:hypothetical protein